MKTIFNQHFNLFTSLILSIALIAVINLTGCSSNDEEEVPRHIQERVLADHTLLVYIVGDNNLSDYATDNFDIISNAYFNTPERNKANLFVYMDNLDGDPVLYWLDPVYGTNRLREYHESNSVSPTVIRDVCATAFGSGKRNNPINSVIFWSHGTNWLQAKNSGLSRSFGDDNGMQVNIADMADAIKGLSIHNLMFDACYMGSVEVAAEFADVADVLVGSPTEILATGFPYHSIIPDLCTSEPDMHKVVDRYFEYYDSQQGQYRSGILTSVNLAGIRTLAETFGCLKYASYGDGPLADAPILSYDRERSHLFYDLHDFAALCRDMIPAEKDNGNIGNCFELFNQAFEECGIYTRHTEQFLGIPLTNPCGLSIYVPRPTTYSALHEFYQTLSWYKWCKPFNK